MLGAFMALDLLLFFLFWEVMLVPMYFLIGIWGSDRRLYSAIKFFIYTLVGSVVMLLGILAIYFHHYEVTGTYSFDLTEWYKLQMPYALQWWVFLAFFLGFAIKVPMFPFHTWLPDAHTDAPTAGSVILAAILLKMGTYGFIRFSLPLLPEGTTAFVPFMVALSLIGIVYGALCAMAQHDWKRLVAYSSVSHLGMAMLGMFALTPVGLAGSIMQQINHGISTGALFLIVGIVYERRHTREISEYGGLSKVMPVYAAIFMIMTMSSIGLPALNGFIGEVMILQGTYVVSKTWAAVAALGIVLGAAYMLWLYQRTMFGKIENPKNEHLPDLNMREFATFLPLLVLAFWIGLYPKPVLQRLEPAVSAVVARVNPVYRQQLAKGTGTDCAETTTAAVSATPAEGAAPFATAACADAAAAPAGASKPAAAHGGDALMPPGLSAGDFYYVLPELVLTAGLLVLLIVESATPREKHGWLAWLSIAILAITGWAMTPFVGLATTAARGVVAVDGFGLFFKAIFLLAAAFTVLLSKRFLEVEGARPGEYHFLVLTATLGMMFMAGGVDLITIFIGLETMAVSFYVLAGFLKPSRRSNEAAVKYFVLGAFSLAILLYGMALMYGLTGTTRLREIAVVLATQQQGLAINLAVILVVAGIGFKIAAVPFHMWAPDVYEGAPTPIAAFLSVGSKAASFAMLLRIFLEGLPAMSAQWRELFYVLAVLSMVVGNVAALTQSNIKRMLAYSSIAHAGYVLIGIIAGTPRGVTATLIYLLVYAFMQMGAFGVVAMLRRQDVIGDELKDLSGLYARNPFAAVAMLVFMLSLGGIPPTAGFMGKFWIFGAAIEAGYVWLAVIGVIASAVSLYYYLRVVVFMWMKPEIAASPVRLTPALGVALGVALAGTIVLGVYPAAAFDWAETSARALGVTPPAMTSR